MYTSRAAPSVSGPGTVVPVEVPMTNYVYPPVDLAAKRPERSSCLRWSIFGCLGALLVLFGVAIGSGVSLAIAIPVMTAHNRKHGASSNAATFANSSSPVESSSDSEYTWRLVATSTHCVVACSPSVQWCPEDATFDCRCEPCSASNASGLETFAMRVYTRDDDDADVNAAIANLGCDFESVPAKVVLGSNCDSVSAWEAAAAEQETETETFGDNGSDVNQRIVGGVQTYIDHYKHQVGIQYRDAKGGGWMCGGNILSSRWVMTAGHCCTQTDLNCNYKVMFGTSTWTQYSGSGGGSCSKSATSKTHRCVAHVYQHPTYRSGLGKIAWPYDLCLLRLAQPLPSVGKWASIPIEFAVPKDGTIARAIGWGLTKAKGSMSPNLLRVELMTRNAVTLRKTRDPATISDGHIGGQYKGRSTCGGDSGGPLLYWTGSQFTLLGVTSFARDTCSTDQAPAVFWRASVTQNWRADIMSRFDYCKARW